MAVQWDVEIKFRNGAKLYRTLHLSDIRRYIRKAKIEKKSTKKFKPIWPWISEIAITNACQSLKTSPKWIDSVVMTPFE